MTKKEIFWSISILPFFILIFLLHNNFLIKYFAIENIKLSDNLFFAILLVSFIMLINILLINKLQPKKTGFVFLGWSMLKIILVMAYFSIFILPSHTEISNAFIYEIIIIYLILLFYEVIFTISLIRK